MVFSTSLCYSHRNRNTFSESFGTSSLNTSWNCCRKFRSRLNGTNGTCQYCRTQGKGSSGIVWNTNSGYGKYTQIRGKNLNRPLLIWSFRMKNTYGPLSSKITLEQLHDLTKDFISSYCFKRNYKSELSLKNVIKCHVILSMMSLHRTSRPWRKRVTAFSNNFLWYSSTKYTDRPITQKSTPFLQNINVSQLCSSMVSGNFDNINGSEFLFPNQKLIYAFVNPLHRKLYIGQTKDLVSRFEQHLRESYKHTTLYH